VPTSHDYRAFASDLAGLDPRVHNNDDIRLLGDMYEWLRDVVPSALFNARPTVEVIDKFEVFKADKQRLRGASAGSASHDETRELMYLMCAACGWWVWRETRRGKDEFPPVPLAFVT
jgi:hypothetical protein